MLLSNFYYLIHMHISGLMVRIKLVNNKASGFSNLLQRSVQTHTHSCACAHTPQHKDIRCHELVKSELYQTAEGSGLSRRDMWLLCKDTHTHTELISFWACVSRQMTDILPKALVPFVLSSQALELSSYSSPLCCERYFSLIMVTEKL